MVTKLEDQQILDATINSVLMGTGDANQQIIEEILDEVISKVVEGAENEQRGASRLLRTEGEHWSQVKKKEVLTSSHLGQVVLNFCSLTIKYLINFKFVRYFIIRISHIFTFMRYISWKLQI